MLDLRGLAHRGGRGGEAPSEWLLAVGDLLPESGHVLDVACGRGRHALLLAEAGFEVEAVDRDRAALARLESEAEVGGLAVRTRTMDLEAGDPVLGDSAFDREGAFVARVVARRGSRGA